MSEQQGNREMVFCHECENEWYRDEYGLTCPDAACQSEFTEIIEADHDPRDDHSDDTLGNPLADPLANPFSGHNPWNAPDPDEGVPDLEDGSANPYGQGFRVQQNGPGQYSITATFHSTIGGPQPQHDQGQGTGADPLFENFRSMITNIRGQGGGAAQEEGEQGQQPEHDDPTQQQQPRRFTYTPAGLQPRDANNPGPQSPPLDHLHQSVNRILHQRVQLQRARAELAELEEARRALDQQMYTNLRPESVITGLLGGAGGGGPFFGPARGGPFGAPHAHEHDHGNEGAAPNPLAAIFATFMNPQMAAHGDAVYSQEALDRVISQLMEQNASGNAPGPATPEAIAALPKRTVTREMLVDDTEESRSKSDEELTGECSICMDGVKLGEQVTELPCHHWFHGLCIEAWLKEHDTCPHCRKGIMPKTEGADNNTNNSNNNNNNGGGGNGPSGSTNNNTGQFPGPGGPSSGSPQPPGNQDNNGGDGGGFRRMPGGFYASYQYHIPGGPNGEGIPQGLMLPPWLVARIVADPEGAPRNMLVPNRQTSHGTSARRPSASNSNTNNDSNSSSSNPGLGERLRRTLFGR